MSRRRPPLPPDDEWNTLEIPAIKPKATPAIVFSDGPDRIPDTPWDDDPGVRRPRTLSQSEDSDDPIESVVTHSFCPAFPDDSDSDIRSPWLPAANERRAPSPRPDDTAVDPRAGADDRRFKDTFGKYLKRERKPIGWTPSSEPVESLPLAGRRREIIRVHRASVLLEHLR